MNPDDTLKADVSFDCPACGAPCQAGSVPEPFVAHRSPPCERYLELGPVEFLSWANEHPRAVTNPVDHITRGDTRKELVGELEKKPKSYDRDELISLAKRGAFHDYKSERFAMPKIELLRRLDRLGYDDIVERVKRGEYDETPDLEDCERMRAAAPELYDRLFPDEAKRRGKT